MLSKLKHIIWSHHPRPTFEDGEEIIREGRVALMKGLGGARLGSLILTNRRLIWYEPAVARPFKPVFGQLNLSDISSVDKGTLYDFIFGGTPLQLRLRNGRDKCLWEADGKLNEWVATIRTVIAEMPR